MSLYLHLITLFLHLHHLFTLIPHPLLSIIHLFNLILHPTLPFSILSHFLLLPLRILPHLLHPHPHPNPFPKPPFPTERKIMPRIRRLSPMHNNTIQLIHLTFNPNHTLLQVNCIMFLHVLILLNVITESFKGQNQVIGVLAD